MIRSFTVVALMYMTSGETATAFDLKNTLKDLMPCKYAGYSTVRTAPTSKRCGFVEVWGDIGRRTTGRNRQAVCGRP